MQPNPPTQISPGTITIRPRREPQDLLPLTHLLQTVYEQDAYPVQGTAHAEEFLTQASTLRAWVAEASPSPASSSSSGEEEKVVEDDRDDREQDGEKGKGWGKGRKQIVGHVAVSRPREGDVAVRLWRELHPRRGSTAGGREKQEAREQDQDQGQGQGQGKDQEGEAEEEEEEPIAILERLFIHPRVRNHGLASSLLRTAEEWARSRTTSSHLEEEHESELTDPKNAKESPKKKKNPAGIRLLLFALLKDEPAMRLYRRRGWKEFGRTGFTWDGASASRDDEEGEGEENDKKEMQAICFVSPSSPSSSSFAYGGH
ncbi:hypothetical protein KC318_g7180 [Hortaea werneckii]|nr:hypothetical protein KC334_g8729 [Hortaea werneckii]KAI7014409.1 hypothetical protein KC355_g4704 [Hortaea werneckii]KAI7184191.1 hypothetical protein KC324_g7770 [Hortaea werneckii]KAI7545063.1 hypothetical protein KC316_g14924 [Hortaea werneckii]KAI7665334.1 hypothetical protein KC318_g7180 [Hortaea werneckii]